MGSSSINLSSLLSALGSSSSGIDVQSAVAQAIAADSVPMQQWEQQQATLQTQTSAIQSIEGDITTLTDSLNALGDPAGALTSMTTTSSNTNVVSASALAGTTAGNHVVVVNNLASTASWYSNSVASGDTQLAAGSFTLQVGSGQPTVINIGGGVDTLNQLATSINGLNLGVSANVVNDASGSRLAIVSNTSGTAANFTISNASGLTFTQAVAGQDASLTIDGIPIDSASNSVSGAVTGVTFNLQSAAPGTEVDVSIAPDNSAASQAISSFVSAYNKVIGDVNTQYTVGSNNQEGPLGGDSALRMLQSILLGSGSYTAASGSIRSLADLGITMNNDGTLTLDSSTLDNAIQNNFGGVQSFLQGTSSNGFGNSLNTQVSALTDPVSGAFTVDLQSISNENKDLQDQINNFQTYLNNQQTLLTNEYNQADILLQQLPEEEAQINAELGYPPTTKS
ncbi:MAG TPA: flagellar filament capping protein FliD [Terriglobales bacterium]|nr:flagellar filament capping protein FliD [Terriglobales bacterium]HXY14403.1 flagellar filament capping protein FliD [Terriglobales bacterium]